MIAIDATPLQTEHRFRGPGTYTAGLLDALTRLPRPAPIGLLMAIANVFGCSGYLLTADDVVLRSDQRADFVASVDTHFFYRGVQDVRTLFRVGYVVAQQDTMPEWKAGTEFKAKRDSTLAQK